MIVTRCICPRCMKRFCNTGDFAPQACPYCAHALSAPESRRNGRRVDFKNDCYILKEGAGLFVKAENISENGIGVKVMGEPPFEKDDELTVILKDFYISAVARVRWITRCSGIISRAGLSFR